MKFVLAALVVLLLAGCTGDGASSLPTAPAPTVPPAATPDSSTEVWGIVIGEGGGCVDDATVEVVRGQGRGRRVKQETPCGYWDYGGGFTLTDLTPGVEMTLRASAPGYRPEQQSVTPGELGGRSIVIELAPIP